MSELRSKKTRKPTREGINKGNIKYFIFLISNYLKYNSLKVIRVATYSMSTTDG